MRCVRRRATGFASELLAMVASTVNSYSRHGSSAFWRRPMRPGNREPKPAPCGSFRVSPLSPARGVSVCGGDINPYLASPRRLRSGLWGIEHRIGAGRAVAGNAYEMAHRPSVRSRARCRKPPTSGQWHHPSPQSVWRHLRRPLCNDPSLEEREIRKAITDWELARLFEII